MSFLPKTKWTWAFAMNSVLQAAVVLALEIYVFVNFQENIITEDNQMSSPSHTIPTFLALYIFAFIYQLVLVWDALRMKNTIQVIGLVGLNVGLLIYGAVQVEQIHDAVFQPGSNIDKESYTNTRPILIAIPCIIAFFTLIMAFVARKLYDEFAWTIYKHISADLRMKRRYLTYQIYIALLKFDFFFCLGFTIQFVVIVGGRSDVERWLTVAAIPVTILIMLAAFFFVRRESLAGSIVIIILYFAGLAYFVFKLVRMYSSNPQFKQMYIAARKELSTFAVLTILCLLMTIIIACMCAHNYGKGLMPYVRGAKSMSAEEKGHAGNHSSDSGYHGSYSTEMTSDIYGSKTHGPGRLAPTRMEID